MADGVKGYWIARLDVENEAEYAAYRALNGNAIAGFGGRFLVRGGPVHVPRGEGRKHNVVVEFPSLEAAEACYSSPEYQAAYQHLKQVGPVDLLIIGGYSAPVA